MAVSLMAHYLPSDARGRILHMRYLPRSGAEMPHHRAMAATTKRPLLVLAGIVLSALALRPQIIAIGPLVDAIDSDLGVSHTVTGLLGTIPLLCMGVFAPTAGPLAARVGATRAMTLVLLTIGVAGIARAVAPGALGVIALTVPIGIGIAIGNVLAPVIVKTAFADRPLLATGLFAFGIQIGAGAAVRSPCRSRTRSAAGATACSRSRSCAQSSPSPGSRSRAPSTCQPPRRARPPCPGAPPRRGASRSCSRSSPRRTTAPAPGWPTPSSSTAGARRARAR